ENETGSFGGQPGTNSYPCHGSSFRLAAAHDATGGSPSGRGGKGQWLIKRQKRNWKRSLKRKRPLCRRRSEEHTSELQSRFDLVCRLLLEPKNSPRPYAARAS